MAATISEKERAILEAPNFAHVATVRADGSPHGVLVWVDLEGDRVALNSAEGRAWPRNVERDPRISLTIANGENPYEYVEIRGRVVEDTHEGADENIDALSKKYLGQETYPFRQPGEQRIIFRIEPEAVRHQTAG